MEEKSFAQIDDQNIMKIVFRRPFACESTGAWPSRREVVKCEAEDRMEVRLSPDGKYETRIIECEKSRNPYPTEIVRQWRYCPFRHEPRLDAMPDVFSVYEDPDVGLCYLFRPLEQSELSRLYKQAGLSLTEKLHPYLAYSVKYLILRAREEGIAIKVISGLRPHTVTEEWVKDGKSSKKVRKVAHRKTWHAFGLAVDVNLEHRKDLASAIKAYQKDPEERRAWQRVGEIGQSLGLKWLGASDDKEIFHFEWHPTWPGRPDTLQKRLESLQKKNGLQGVWRELSYDPERPTAFRHLEDRHSDEETCDQSKD